MSLAWGEAMRLAAKGGPADRLRRWLIAGCAALGVSILASAVTVPRYWDQRRLDEDSFSVLGNVLAQRGLALGIMLALALSAVPVIHLAMQAIKVGAPERDRRLAGMRAAGATGSDLRAVLRGEALVCTCLGVVTGLGTWALTLTALSRWVRIEYSSNWDGVEEGSMPLLVVLWPTPWLLVLSAVAVIAVAAGMLPLSARRLTSPRRQLRPAEHEMHPVLAWSLLASMTTAVVAVVALLVVNTWLGGSSQGDSLLTNGLLGLLLVAAVGLLLSALAAAGPGVARWVGRGLARCEGATPFLASRMLQAHPALAARTAVSLVLVAFVGGVAIPVKAILRAQAVEQVERNGEVGPGGAERSPDVLGYVVPATAVEVLVVVTACLASVGLLVAIREQVSLRGEALSELTAQGVPARVLRRSLVLEAVAPSMVMSTVALIVGVVVAAMWGSGTGGFVSGAMWARLIGLWILLVGGAAAAAHVGSRRVGRAPQRIRDRE